MKLIRACIWYNYESQPHIRNWWLIIGIVSVCVCVSVSVQIVDNMLIVFSLHMPPLVRWWSKRVFFSFVSSTLSSLSSLLLIFVGVVVFADIRWKPPPSVIYNNVKLICACIINWYLINQTVHQREREREKGNQHAYTRDQSKWQQLLAIWLLYI